VMQSYLRVFFAWSYSQFFIGGLFAAGVAMLTYSHFVPAYIFFSIGGLWAVIYWQVSDHLTNKATELRKRREKLVNKPKQQRTILGYSRARRTYWLWNLSGSSVLVLLTSACLLWTYWTQVEYGLSLASGWLVPASDSTPDAGPCGVPPPDALMLYLGNEAVIARHFPHPVLTVSHKGMHEITSTLFLQNTRGGIPPQEIVPCPNPKKPAPVSPFPATLMHSCSRKSCVCRSYENTWDGYANAAGKSTKPGMRCRAPRNEGKGGYADIESV
jgi:hypothetical protein